MPRDHRFRHQRYQASAPVVRWEALVPPPAPPLGSDSYRELMAAVGCQLRWAGVRAIYLLHGTFAGDDALGMLRLLAAMLPGAARELRRMSKSLIDAVARDAGNYTGEFAAEFQNATQVPVRLFSWSSENHHVGRAHAAASLISELVDQGYDRADRILLWGHSHAGNVLALMTNLLAGDHESNGRFFQACRGFYGRRRCDEADVWVRLRDWLDSDPLTRRLPQLDMVTFGTPIRYGWDPGGYAKLLHFVNHHPRPGLPLYRTALPRSLEDLLQAADGDYIQQLGIAGTNIAPPVLAFRTWLADRKLSRLLDGHLSARELLAAWKVGRRVPEEGETLLVDYGPPEGHVWQHLAGHAVYTRVAWLAFHASEVARRFYGS